MLGGMAIPREVRVLFDGRQHPVLAGWSIHRYFGSTQMACVVCLEIQRKLLDLPRLSL